MIGSIVLLIFVGVLLEGLPSLNVLAPLLLPIAGKVGLSELHYALVLIIAMGVGGFMPLAGVGFYVCCAVMRCDIETASRAMFPYLAVVLAGLLIVAFVPWFAFCSCRIISAFAGEHVRIGARRRRSAIREEDHGSQRVSRDRRRAPPR